MPGLLQNFGHVASSSSSKADATRRLFSKPYHGKQPIEELPPLPSAMHTNGVRVFPVHFAQPSGASKLFFTKPPHQTGGNGLNYSSSGSDHEPTSVCLASMVKEFMESDGAVDVPEGCAADSTMDYVGNPKSVPGEESLQILEGLLRDSSAANEKLEEDVAGSLKHMGIAETNCRAKDASLSHACVKRLVMKRLRDKGYNAGICKSRWDHLCGMPAGDYEYIDVLIEESGSNATDRFIIDLNFPVQFEIARPTADFLTACELLPPIFVGKPDKLKQIVCIMSQATKRSLRSQGLHLPPWRKVSYMNAKWFSPYKRTCNDTIYSCGQPNAFAGIAVRECGLDAPSTNELDMLYHEAGSTFEGKAGSEIIVFTTGWKLPPVIAPKRSASTTGLASAFLQARTGNQCYPLVQGKLLQTFESHNPI